MAGTVPATAYEFAPARPPTEVGRRERRGALAAAQKAESMMLSRNRRSPSAAHAYTLIQYAHIGHRDKMPGARRESGR